MAVQDEKNGLQNTTAMQFLLSQLTAKPSIGYGKQSKDGEQNKNDSSSNAPTPNKSKPKLGECPHFFPISLCPQCNKKGGGGRGSHTPGEEEEQQDLHTSTMPSLVIKPKPQNQKTKEELEKEFKEQQKHRVDLIVCQANVTLSDIVKQFELFVNALAQQQGLTAQEFMKANPGLQCELNGDFLTIRFPESKMMYHFLQQLGDKHMIEIPNGLQQYMDNFQAQQKQTLMIKNTLTPQEQNKSMDNEQLTQSMFNPFSTTLTPTGMKYD